MAQVSLSRNWLGSALVCLEESLDWNLTPSSLAWAACHQTRIKSDVFNRLPGFKMSLLKGAWFAPICSLLFLWNGWKRLLYLGVDWGREQQMKGKQGSKHYWDALVYSSKPVYIWITTVYYLVWIVTSSEKLWKNSFPGTNKREHQSQSKTEIPEWNVGLPMLPQVFLHFLYAFSFHIYCAYTAHTLFVKVVGSVT